MTDEKGSHEKESHEHIKKAPRTVTIKLTKTNMIIGGLVVALIFSIFTGGFGTGDGSGDGTGAVIVDSGSRQPTAPSRIDINLDDDAVKGDPDAPVTIIEFSDFECPFCARFYTQTLPSLQEEYIDTGKAKLIYRDLPLPFHADAQKAAEAAECAGDQGRYWGMHDAIFETDDISVAGLKSLASDLNLDLDDFNQCLDSDKYEDEVQADYRYAQSIGASGTPTFFIGNEDNGYIKLVGAQPFAVFKQAIDAELA